MCRNEGVFVTRQAVDELDDTGSVLSLQPNVDFFAHHRKRVRNGRRTAADVKKRKIVFGIADAEHAVWPKSERMDGGAKPARLVDTGWEHHERAFVERDLDIETELADDVAHGRLACLSGRDDANAHRKRRDVSRAKRVDQRGGCARRKRSLLSCRGLVEHCAVFDNGEVAQVESRKDVLEIGALPAADENEAAARLLQPRERRDRGIVDDAVAGDRAVVVGCESEEAQIRAPVENRRRTNPAERVLRDLRLYTPTITSKPP